MSTSESLKNAMVVTADEAVDREEISSVLTKVGFEILPSPGGPLALDRHDKRRPVDLVVIDASALKVKPSEIAERAHQISPRVLFLSDGKGEQPPSNERGHVSGILSKPFRRAQLLGRV